MYNYYNYQRQPQIISSKNPTASARGPSTGLSNSVQNDQLTMLELSTGLILPALDITVPGSTIRFKRLRFRLKWVLKFESGRYIYIALQCLFREHLKTPAFQRSI